MKNNKKPESLWDTFSRSFKRLGKYILPILIIILGFGLLFPPNEKSLGYNEFTKAVKEKRVEILTIGLLDGAYKISGKLADIESLNDTFTKGRRFSLVIPREAEFEDNQKLIGFLSKYDVEFDITEKRNKNNWLVYFLVSGGLVLVFFLIFLRPLGKSLNEQQKYSDGYLDRYKNYGKKDEKNKITDANVRQKIGPNVTFQDVAGLKEAKEELQEIIDFLKNPTQFSKLGGRVPRGALLAGPTGSGKTLLARAVAGEAGAGFFSMSGSEFVEMFVGVGASRVRSLFSRARKNPPAIIFIDEIDAVGRHRGAGLGSGHDEREQTLNQILVEMDGFEQREGIIVLAATNRPDMLDKAILRPGRFDRKIYTNLPDIEDREAILKVHARNKILGPDIDLKIIARGTPGFSGADLENLTNEAALRAARKKKDQIEMEDMEWAKEKVLMGTEKKIIITEDEKKTTAYHEVGHALVALFCPEADPLHKVSIIPRGQALGITVQLPLKDKHIYSKQELNTQLTVFMAGRVAEELFLHQLTTGASNDIEVATGIARAMVCNFGMSDLGPLNFGQKQGEVFLGRDFVQVQDYGEDTAKKIDEEIKKLIDGAYQKAKEILEENKNKVEKLVKFLIEKETLDREEVKKLLNIKNGVIE